MNKLIICLSILWSIGAFSKMNEEVCSNVKVGIEKTIYRLGDNKKIQIVIGRLVKKQGKIFLNPELHWHKEAEVIGSVQIFLPMEKSYNRFEEKRGVFGKDCRPDFSVKNGDRIVLFNSEIDSKILDLSDTDFKFFVLGKKNKKDSFPVDLEIDERELVKLLNSTFGPPRVFMNKN